MSGTCRLNQLATHRPGLRCDVARCQVKRVARTACAWLTRIRSGLMAEGVFMSAPRAEMAGQRSAPRLAAVRLQFG
jgi:hypothetical protein